MRAAFETARQMVAARDVAQRYGVRIDRGGFALCPFHAEKTPSCHFYPDGSFYCFSCGKGGDAITFTAELLGLDRLGALRRLNADFSLRLPLDRPPTESERAQASMRRRVAETERRFAEWREQLSGLLCAAIRVGNTAELSAPDTLTPEQVEALQWREVLEHWLECLSDETLSKQMEIFRMRQEVELRCSRVLNSTVERSKTA